jgi:hypothetical protein
VREKRGIAKRGIAERGLGERRELVRGESHSSETHNLAEFDCQVEGLERSRWRAWRGVTERVPRAEDLRPVNGNESGER